MDNSVQMKMLLFIDLNDDVMGCTDVLLLSVSFFFLFLPMSGYVLNVVISNEKKKKTSKMPIFQKSRFFNNRFSPLMFVL